MPPKTPEFESFESMADATSSGLVQVAAHNAFQLFQTAAIGCHNHVCRGENKGRDELFKLILRSLSKFYVDIRIRLEGGKATPLMRARVALNRVVRRKGKKRSNGSLAEERWEQPDGRG